jgi:hypothetical protein
MAFATAIERDGNGIAEQGPAHEGKRALEPFQRGQRRQLLRRQSAPQDGGTFRPGCRRRSLPNMLQSCVSRMDSVERALWAKRTQ